MTFLELQSLTKFILNANDSQTDKDLSSTRLKELINLAYTREVNRAKQEGGRRWFRSVQNVTWPASQVNLSAPASAIGSELIEIRDITDDALGEALSFSETGAHGDLFWKDRSTLQWGDSGPGEAKTLQFVFYAKPVKLVADDDAPDLFPEVFQEVIAWSAAVLSRTILDEAAPQAWYKELENLRLDLWKFLSRGRPMNDTSSSQVGVSADWDLGTTPQDGSSIGN